MKSLKQATYIRYVIGKLLKFVQISIQTYMLLKNSYNADSVKLAPFHCNWWDKEFIWEITLIFKLRVPFLIRYDKINGTKMKFKCQVYACHDGDLVDLAKIGKLQKRVLKVMSCYFTVWWVYQLLWIQLHSLIFENLIKMTISFHEYLTSYLHLLTAFLFGNKPLIHK